MPAENKIRVTAIQRLCVHDGPGVRTTVFLKGCYLQCPWCCNPETISYEEDALYDKGVCKKNPSSIICRNCILAGGRRPKEECPLNAYEKTYTDYGADELFALLMRDRHLYENGGGITFSGGEPLYQAVALFSLLQRLKDENVHIAMETSLYVPYSDICLLEPYVDYWLVDLKFQYGHIAGRQDADSRSIDMEKSLEHIQSLAAPDSICYRMVVMGEMADKLGHIIRRLKSHHIGRIELLGYHSLGKNKYEELGKRFHPFTPLSKAELERIVSVLTENNIAATYLSV